jgi:hypothetical protein
VDEHLKKKKKSTALELAVGGGLMAIFLPVIVGAVLWTLIAVTLALLYMVVHQRDMTTFGPVLIVYGVLLLAMLVLAYKFSARFVLLSRRLVGLLRERRRIRAETKAAESPGDARPASAQTFPEVDRQSSAQHSSRR